MQWFGEPGPMNTVGKGANPPAVANGIALYLGRGIIAVDAYNGTVLWQWNPAEDVLFSRRKNSLLMDDKYVYYGEIALDLKTGKPAEGVTASAKAISRAWRGTRSREDLARYLGTRIHPLTGGLAGKGFGKSHGCVGAGLSAAMDFFRSGSFSYYDFEDDSGVRNLAGLRPACHPSKTAGLGLLLVADGQGAAANGVPNRADYGTGCDCRFSFLGSLAMVPAQRRSNEDWALFSDPRPELTAGPIRHVNMNFGAPGDRRHTDKTLWLSVPRPHLTESERNHWLSMQLPYVAEFYDGDQSYRRNGDRLALAGTDQSWVYTSGLRGLKSLTLGLDYYDLNRQYIALPCVTGPKIDGRLDDGCWNGAAPLSLRHLPTRQRELYRHPSPKPAESAWMRYDEDNLYVAYWQCTRESLKPWDQGKYVVACKIDHFDLLLKGSGGKVIHLGAAPSGAASDALITLTGAGKAVKAGPRDDSWNGHWQSAVSAKEDGFVVEAAVPWKTLAAEGIHRKDLRALVHPKVNIPYLKWPNATHVNRQVYLSKRGTTPKPYSVWLHFADVENETTGKRVFDVKLQGNVVLKDFDIVAEAGGKNRAVVKEFKGIMALDEIEFELVPSTKDVKPAAAPIISGMQVLAEQPGPVPEPVLGIMTNGKGNSGFVLMSELEKMPEKNRMGVRGWTPEAEAELRARLKRRGQLPEQEKKPSFPIRNTPTR